MSSNEFKDLRNPRNPWNPRNPRHLAIACRWDMRQSSDWWSFGAWWRILETSVAHRVAHRAAAARRVSARSARSARSAASARVSVASRLHDRSMSSMSSYPRCKIGAFLIRFCFHLFWILLGISKLQQSIPCDEASIIYMTMCCGRVLCAASCCSK